MTVTIRYYDTQTRENGFLPSGSIEAERRKPGRILWVDAEDPDEKDLAWIAGEFPVTAELTAAFRGENKVRPFAWYGDAMALRYVRVRYDLLSERLESGPFHVIAHPEFMITVHGKTPEVFEALERQWHDGRLGEHALAYSVFLVVDSIVSGYQDAADEVRVRADMLMGKAGGGYSAEMIASVPVLRQQLYELLRYMRLFRVAAASFQHIITGSTAFDVDKQNAFFDIIGRHLSQVRDEISVSLDLLNEMMQGYQTYQSDRLNRNVSRLTLLGILLATFQVIAGVLAIDLTKIFPRLIPLFGVLIVFLLFAISAFLELVFFKRKGWLR